MWIRSKTPQMWPTSTFDLTKTVSIKCLTARPIGQRLKKRCFRKELMRLGNMNTHVRKSERSLNITQTQQLSNLRPDPSLLQPRRSTTESFGKRTLKYLTLKLSHKKPVPKENKRRWQESRRRGETQFAYCTLKRNRLINLNGEVIQQR
eukprot:PhF_6_TR19934/c0_g1_i2/m.29004